MNTRECVNCGVAMLVVVVVLLLLIMMMAVVLGSFCIAGVGPCRDDSALHHSAHLSALKFGTSKHAHTRFSSPLIFAVKSSDPLPPSPSLVPGGDIDPSQREQPQHAQCRHEAEAWCLG